MTSVRFNNARRNKGGKMITEQQDYYTSLIEHLRRLPVETEWLEYKSNNTDPQMIGEYISALSNSAALEGKEREYLIWGVDDFTKNLFGRWITGSMQSLIWEHCCLQRI